MIVIHIPRVHVTFLPPTTRKMFSSSSAMFLRRNHLNTPPNSTLLQPCPQTLLPPQFHGSTITGILASPPPPLVFFLLLTLHHHHRHRHRLFNQSWHPLPLTPQLLPPLKQSQLSLPFGTASLSYRFLPPSPKFLNELIQKTSHPQCPPHPSPSLSPDASLTTIQPTKKPLYKLELRPWVLHRPNNSQRILCLSDNIPHTLFDFFVTWTRQTHATKHPPHNTLATTTCKVTRA